MNVKLIKQEWLPFTQISNKLLNDSTLSLKAKWLYCYLYSKPDDWSFSSVRIANDHKQSEKSIQSWLIELENHWWLERKKQHDWTMIYKIYWEKMSQSENGLDLPCTPKGQTAPLGDIYNIDIIDSNIYKENNNNIDNINSIDNNINNNIYNIAENSKKENVENSKKEISTKSIWSIINKSNKQLWVSIYDTIKSISWVVDWNLSDCIVLYYKLKQLSTDPTALLQIILQKMIDTWIGKYYSIASPKKLSENLWTIIAKIQLEFKPKTKSWGKDTFIY